MGGGGMGGRGGGSREPPNTTELYETLGVDKDATKGAIKKAYHKLCRTHHPDKGGDEEEFKKIKAAYEVLSDPEKRERYNKYGLDGVSEDGGGGGAEDLFSAFFGGGGGGGRGRRRGPRKNASSKHALKVSLEDLYKGKTVKLAITRDVICEGCDGKGGAREATCSTCGGQGAVIQVRRMGNMVQQMQTVCPTCRGSGTDIAEEDKCKQCNGRKVKKSRDVLEVFVEPGMKHGQKIVFKGQADAKPGMEPGDMIFIIQEKKHPRFKRQGINLVYQHHITLQEALCGSKFVLTHLDERELMISTPPGMVIKPGSLKGIRGEGMPIKGNQFEKGLLFIHYIVDMPDASVITPQVSAALSAVLPAGEPVPEDEPEELETVTLTEMDPDESFRATQRAGREAYDSDDDEHRPQRGVQCAHQ